MTRSRTVTALATCLTALLLSAAPALAQSQILVLQLEGINGDSEITNLGPPNPKGIDVLSFSWGVANAAILSRTNLSTGKPAFTDLTLTLDGGRAVPDLVLRTALGQVIPSAKFSVFESSGDGRFAKYILEFKQVYLTGVQSGGSSGDRVIHVVSMAYGELKITVRTRQADGSVTEVTQGWTLLENRQQ